MFKFLAKIKKDINEAQQIVDKLPDNTTITKEILGIIGNNKTKLILEPDFKNSYYVYLKDTIYLSDKPKNQTIYTRVSLIAHECIHSIQPKLIQLVNFIFSNIELLSFIIFLIFAFITHNTNLIYMYLIIQVITIIPRIILEMWAIVSSVKLSFKYLNIKLEEKEAKKLLKLYKNQIVLLLPFFLISLIFARIVRLVLVYLSTIIYI